MPLPLFQTRAVVRVHLVDEAAFVQFTHQTAVNDIFDFDFPDFWIARFQQALGVSQSFEGRKGFPIDAADEIQVGVL